MIELPEGYELVSPELSLNIENTIGKLEIMLRKEGNVVIITRDISLKKNLIQYNDFDAFNALWKPWMNPSFQKLILKKPE